MPRIAGMTHQANFAITRGPTNAPSSMPRTTQSQGTDFMMSLLSDREVNGSEDFA